MQVRCRWAFCVLLAPESLSCPADYHALETLYTAGVPGMVHSQHDVAHPSPFAQGGTSVCSDSALCAEVHGHSVHP